MTIAVGLLLGAGVLLAFAPVLWPATRAARQPPSSFVGATLAHAGLHRVSMATVLAVSVVTAALAAALSFAFIPVVPLAAAACLVGLVVPWSVITLRARRRRRSARLVWPDVVDQLVSAVRSGQSLPDSLGALALVGPAATREAFATFAADYRATGNFGTCVSELKDRLADPTADRILETLRMSREVGGSELTTVLRNLASYLRQESALRSEVEARQSWVINAARLGVAAPWIVLLLLATRPEAAAAYNTPAGAALVVGGLVVTVIAYRIMIAIGHIPDERRWFK